MQRALPGNVGVERREHLRNYLLACVRDNVLSWADLKSPSTLDNLLRAFSRDVRDVVADLGRNGGANALRFATQVIGQKLMDIASGLEADAQNRRK